MQTTTKILLSLIVLALIDTLIPLPITGIILIYVFYEKPEWFRRWVWEIYQPNGTDKNR